MKVWQGLKLFIKHTVRSHTVCTSQIMNFMFCFLFFNKNVECQNVTNCVVRLSFDLNHFVPFQSKLHMDGFRSLKEGEEVEFTFKKSSKGLESQKVTGPGGIHCVGSERRPKSKKVQKRRSKGDR